MRPRKIDDDVLIKMLHEGKPQKEIAERFHVSPVAVCRRLKRLAPPPEMPNFDQLTAKEKRFVLEKVRGKGNIQAVMQSHDVTTKGSAKSMASQLMAKHEIQMSITELMDYCGIDKTYRIRRLKQIIDSSDLNIAHKGLDMSFKLDGSYAPEKHLEVSVNVLNLSLRELEEERKRLQAILGEEEELTPSDSVQPERGIVE